MGSISGFRKQKSFGLVEDSSVSDVTKIISKILNEEIRTDLRIRTVLLYNKCLQFIAVANSL